MTYNMYNWSFSDAKDPQIWWSSCYFSNIKLFYFIFKMGMCDIMQLAFM